MDRAPGLVSTGGDGLDRDPAWSIAPLIFCDPLYRGSPAGRPCQVLTNFD